MVGVEHADASQFGSSMSSCLPLLVFHHHHPNNNGQEDDEDEDEDEMLMFSISDQSLHRNMECGHDSAGNSSMCWTTPSQGWMLLAQDRDTVSSVCLWNPCTGDKLPLPDIVEEEHQILYHCKCILSHKDPTHPGCVVVLFNRAAPEFWYCHTATNDSSSSRRIEDTTNDSSSNSRWRHYTYDIGNYPSIPKPPKGKKARRSSRPIKNTIVHMASFQGKIYFRKSNKDMCAIDFSSCTSTANHNDRPTFQKFNFRMVGLPEEFSSGRQWLVESQDQLFVVTIGFVDFNPNNIGAIEVHRMDSSSSSSQRPLAQGA